MGIIKKCPICGNYVEGKRKQSYVKKVTKTGVKTAVNGAASIGAAGTGAAIGSAILPGIGTIIGGAAGLIGSAMFHTGVNDAIDGVADAVTDAEYEFTCPSCGHQWSGDDDEIDSDYDDADEDDEDEYDEVAVINQSVCINCGACAAECDEYAIDEDDDRYTIDPDLCTRCGACISECPVNAISFVNKARYQIEYNQSDQHEQEYVNHLKELLEDDSEITPRERKMLDHIRQKLGISEERAKELEEMLLNPELTEEEQQYLDNVREFFEDDTDITPRERKMLNRIRESLGISEERAEELEQMAVNPRLKKDEQEYIDMYRDYAENGKITDKERRKLDKFASALGISAERVKALEKLA